MAPAPPQTRRAVLVRALVSAAPGGPALYSSTRRLLAPPKGAWWPLSIPPCGPPFQTQGPVKATDLGIHRGASGWPQVHPLSYLL